jgi:IS5 family transposase
MLIDRYPCDDMCARVPQMAVRIDPILRRLDALLDDDTLSQAAQADIGQRHPRTRTCGRPSTPAEMLLFTYLQNWSLQETDDQVDQNLIRLRLHPAV